MTEQELIAKISVLSQIKPRKEWVILTKKQILSQDKKPQEKASWLEFLPKIVLQYKYALACLVIIGILVATFGFSQNALPGDFLYSFKKISEKTRAVFVSEKERPKAQIELVNRRLRELTTIVTTNQITKLAPAIEEYQESFSEATKMASTIKEAKEVKEIVPRIREAEETVENLKSYGVVIGAEEEPVQLYRPIVEPLITDLEKRTLSSEQEVLFTQAKEDFEAGDYAQALEKVLILSNSF